nr:uncharacterized protein LOC108071719 isoform X1 [Drosophila kikkawai]
MCFGKFFGGRHGNRSNAVATEGVTVRPSLANVPQVSVDNIRSVKSTKSTKSVKSGKSMAAASRVTVNLANQRAPSVNTIGSEAKKSVLVGPGGGVSSASASVVPNAAGGSATGSGTADGSSRSVPMIPSRSSANC